MSTSPDECAQQVLTAIPLVMRAIRTEMRSRRGADLSVPQFRVLVYLHRHPGASLSEIAEHLGLTLPSMSKMIDGLVSRSLVDRRTNAADRRRVTLAATGPGQETMLAALKATESRLAEHLALRPASERRTIFKAMQMLAAIFGTDREANPHGK